jgi:hypothetical protein
MSTQAFLMNKLKRLLHEDIEIEYNYQTPLVKYHMDTRKVQWDIWIPKYNATIEFQAWIYTPII